VPQHNQRPPMQQPPQQSVPGGGHPVIPNTRVKPDVDTSDFPEFLRRLNKN